MQPRPLFLCCVKSQIPVSVAPALCFAQHLSLQSLCSSPFPVAMGTSLFVLHTLLSTSCTSLVGTPPGPESQFQLLSVSETSSPAPRPPTLSRALGGEDRPAPLGPHPSHFWASGPEKELYLLPSGSP